MFTQSSPIVCPQSWDVRVRPAIKSRVAVCIRACYLHEAFYKRLFAGGTPALLGLLRTLLCVQDSKTSGKMQKE